MDRRPRRSVILLASLTLLAGLGASRLTYHEAIWAQTAREMIASGDWLVPTLDGQAVAGEAAAGDVADRGLGMGSAEASRKSPRGCPSALAAMALCLVVTSFAVEEIRADDKPARRPDPGDDELDRRARGDWPRPTSPWPCDGRRGDGGDGPGPIGREGVAAVVLAAGRCDGSGQGDRLRRGDPGRRDGHGDPALGPRHEGVSRPGLRRSASSSPC